MTLLPDPTPQEIAGYERAGTETVKPRAPWATQADADIWRGLAELSRSDDVDLYKLAVSEALEAHRRANHTSTSSDLADAPSLMRALAPYAMARAAVEAARASIGPCDGAIAAVLAFGCLTSADGSVAMTVRQLDTLLDRGQESIVASMARVRKLPCFVFTEGRSTTSGTFLVRLSPAFAYADFHTLLAEFGVAVSRRGTWAAPNYMPPEYLTSDGQIAQGSFSNSPEGGPATKVTIASEVLSNSRDDGTTVVDRIASVLPSNSEVQLSIASEVRGNSSNGIAAVFRSNSDEPVELLGSLKSNLTTRAAENLNGRGFSALPINAGCVSDRLTPMPKRPLSTLKAPPGQASPAHTSPPGSRLASEKLATVSEAAGARAYRATPEVIREVEDLFTRHYREGWGPIEYAIKAKIGYLDREEAKGTPKAAALDQWPVWWSVRLREDEVMLAFTGELDWWVEMGFELARVRNVLRALPTRELERHTMWSCAFGARLTCEALDGNVDASTVSDDLIRDSLRYALQVFEAWRYPSDDQGVFGAEPTAEFQ